MDHSLDFIEFLGAGGVIEAVSAAISTLGGYDPKDLIGRHYQEILHPEDCEKAVMAFMQVLNGANPKPVTLRYHHKDGSWKTIQATARNFLNDPAVRAIIVLTRDITDQIDAEFSLAQANRELRRLSQQLIVTREKERHHIARELHDDVQQILVGLRMKMEASLRAPRLESPSDPIVSWLSIVREAIEHIHNLTLTLWTPIIGKRGLALELQDYVDRLTLDDGQEVHLAVSTDCGVLAPNVELACYRIVQEGLANAIAHSQATEINVSLICSNSEVSVSIDDDGVGFDMPAARDRASDGGNIGLLSMRERAALAGGRLEVRSSMGQGTSVRASFRIS